MNTAFFSSIKNSDNLLETPKKSTSYDYDSD